uniref:Uncharacterized protein n=1 Tax=Setaria viridis TaxID=4556 RepID=A0A4U6TZM1_SETVI|nr:hypothetical protein SEVIR_7G296800v2 [Setaria viridis]
MSTTDRPREDSVARLAPSIPANGRLRGLGSGASDPPPQVSASPDPKRLSGRRMTALLTQPAASTHARPHCTSYSICDLLPFATRHSWPAPPGAEGSLARLASRAPGGRDVTSALRKPSAGRRDPPPPPTDTRVATKRPHHRQGATAATLLRHTRRQTSKAGEDAGNLGTRTTRFLPPCCIFTQLCLTLYCSPHPVSPVTPVVSLRYKRRIGGLRQGGSTHNSSHHNASKPTEHMETPC